MIVIATKTETRLRDDLRRLATAKPNQRCFYLACSKTNIQKGVLFEAFLRQLEDIPNAYSARVYLCHDKDVFIMMEAFMQRQFLTFVETLGEEFGDKNFKELMDVFEVGLDWDTLEDIYTQKIEAISENRIKQTEEEKSKRTEEITLSVMSELKPEIISTISSRRAERLNTLVMMADDDQLARTLARNVLKDHNDLVFARNGSEAIQTYVESAPDILFLDIGMPDINGQEVLEVLFQIDPEAYIIMFSGRKDKTTIMTSLEKGAQGFLGKPFTREQLYTHVQNSPFIQAKHSDVT